MEISLLHNPYTRRRLKDLNSALRNFLTVGIIFFMDKKALSGLKVLECADFIAGPYCGKLLADLGAEVIKVEKPDTGDDSRRHGPFPQDIPNPEKSGLFLYLNANKLGITLDVESSTGANILKELLKETFAPVDSELQRDLWPQMLARLDRQPSRVPWLDWALLALVAIWCFLSPGIIPVLLYHL